MVAKRLHKSRISHHLSQKLTKTEAEVLQLLTEEFYTPKQVSKRRQTTYSAVTKTIRNLKKKGYLTRDNQKVAFSDPTTQPPQVLLSSEYVRWHAQHFIIKVLYDFGRYQSIRGKANVVFVEGSTVKLHAESIEVYCKKSFVGESVEKATFQGLEYFSRLFARLENDFDVRLLKPRCTNIKLCVSHYALVRNGVARNLDKSGERLRVYTKEDGKLAYLVDNSFNLHEFEAVHPDTASVDLERARKQLLDWRDNDPPTLTELYELVAKTVELQKETSAGLAIVTKLLVPGGGLNGGDRPRYVG